MYKIHRYGSMSSTLFSMDLEQLKRQVETRDYISFFKKVLNYEHVEMKWEKYQNKWRYYCYYYSPYRKGTSKMCVETIIKLK